MQGLNDIYKTVKGIKLPIYLARADIRQRYRRSSLGPFWITISTAVTICCIGFIFGGLFKSTLSNFLPFVTAGFIVWGFMSSTLIEATTVFPSSEAIIKQLDLPIFMHVVRMVARNLYIFFHNFVIYPILVLFLQIPVSWKFLFIVPGLALLLINLLWVSLLLGIICARYRDMTQIIASFLQIAFYFTPIIWMPSSLPNGSKPFILGPNPFYHLIELVRAPLLNSIPSLMNWCVTLLLAIIGWVVTVFVFNKYRRKVAYWL